MDEYIQFYNYDRLNGLIPMEYRTEAV
ncbi:TPA: IS3 family transposase [Bacillus toyonensis]|nr:IS3 family transposase [Bacillus toyonensis]